MFKKLSNLFKKEKVKTSNEENAKNVTRNTIYDVASLTKILSTTPVTMKLIEKKKNCWIDSIFN